MTRILATICLLVCSNAFMTAAWYGHLKWFKPDGAGGRSLLAILGIVLVSWLIALPEYLLQVPGNRIGHIAHGGPFTTPQLKILQEAITLVVFAAFSIVVLKDKLRINDVIAFALIFLAVVVAMMGRGRGPA
jgi:hypothetical protein